MFQNIFSLHKLSVLFMQRHTTEPKIYIPVSPSAKKKLVRKINKCVSKLKMCRSHQDGIKESYIPFDINCNKKKPLTNKLLDNSSQINQEIKKNRTREYSVKRPYRSA